MNCYPQSFGFWTSIISFGITLSERFIHGKRHDCRRQNIGTVLGRSIIAKFLG
jgi:hypothetical protein